MDGKENSIYPSIASAPPNEGNLPYWVSNEPKTTTHSFALDEIKEIQRDIKDERERRAALAKKYHRASNIIDGIDYALITASVGLEVTGIALLSTIVAVPLALITGGVGLAVGALSIIGTAVNKKLMLKAEKHEKIKMLAGAKLNTINDHISKALKDEKISDEEYSLILGESAKFEQMKEEIRSKIRVELDEETKQNFIDMGRKEAIDNFQSMYAAGKLSSRKGMKKTF